MSEHKKVEYLCLACGWKKAIPALWSDSKPKMCGNKKCRKHFLIHPDKLATYDPAEVEHARAMARQVEAPAEAKSTEQADKKHKYGKK